MTGETTRAEGRSRQGRSGIAVITAGGPYPWVIVNALGERFGRIDVIVEEGEGYAALLRRRMRQVGLFETAGQFCTMVAIRLMKRASQRRTDAIVAEHGLRTEPDPLHALHRVGSANGADCLALLASLRPRVVLLAGCRLLTRSTLAALPCPVLNYHAGITPAYRGMNGGYFALAEGDAANFGATVHLVDAGVDTGAVLYQVRAVAGPHDTIATYPMLLAAASRDICCKAVADALDGRLAPVAVDLPSRQWRHPPIWSYLATGLRRGVW